MREGSKQLPVGINGRISWTASLFSPKFVAKERSAAPAAGRKERPIVSRVRQVTFCAIGLHKVPVLLHPEVEVTVSVAVGRNADEARRIARGEEITLVREEGEETPAEAEAAAPAAEAFLEPQAKARRDRDGAADIGEAGASPTPQEKKA